MTDFKYLADLLMPGLRSQQMKLQEVDQWLDSLIKTLRERKPVWQDIAYAPKDGTVVLVYPNYHFAVTCGHCANEIWRDDLDGNFEIHPTHWMHLPEPPE